MTELRSAIAKGIARAGRGGALRASYSGWSSKPLFSYS